MKERQGYMYLLLNGDIVALISLPAYHYSAHFIGAPFISIFYALIIQLSVVSICSGWTVSSHPDGLQELARISVLAIDGSVGLLECVRLWSPDPACAPWLSLSSELVVIQRTSMYERARIVEPVGIPCERSHFRRLQQLD